MSSLPHNGNHFSSGRKFTYDKGDTKVAIFNRFYAKLLARTLQGLLDLKRLFIREKSIESCTYDY